MDFDECAVTNSDANKSNLNVISKDANAPIITFSPNRTRFDPGTSHLNSLNSSITSDFDRLELNPSVEIKTNPNPNAISSTSITALLSSTSSLGQPLSKPVALSLLPSSQDQLNVNLNSGRNTSHFDFNLGLNLVDTKLSHEGVNNCNADVGGSSKSVLMASTMGKVSTASDKVEEDSCLSSSDVHASASASSTSQLQKKLERKIAMASAIAETMNSMSNSNLMVEIPSLSTPNDMNEFSDWNSNTSPTTRRESQGFLEEAESQPVHANATQDRQGELDSSQNSDRPASRNKTASKSKSSKIKGASKNRPSAGETHRPAVRFQENEVEIISKSSRGRVPGGLIPPERLAIPNKGLMNNSTNNKQASGDHNSRKEDNSDDRVGRMSEAKPLVEWDSDESEEELSFFPTSSKPKGKLTDNLSIDNMSLSGDEDDLHLSPPRALTQKCPCDPREWISDHVRRIPKSYSFPQSGTHCVIS